MNQLITFITMFISFQDGEPQKSPEGPYLNRIIPLPMESNFTSTENLIPKEGINVITNF